jgi:hypothetical protein
LSSSISNFTFKNGPFTYFINDDELDGDIYTESAGDDGNSGTTRASPKASLTNLLATTDLDPGDIVYVDTGDYTDRGSPAVGAADSGAGGAPVRLIFSTNGTAGGALSGPITFSGASAVELIGPVIAGGKDSISVAYSGDILISDARLRNATESGVKVLNSSEVRIQHSLSYNHNSNGIYIVNSPDVELKHVVLWNNGHAGLNVDSGNATLTNSVIGSSSAYASLYRLASVANLRANYNNLYTGGDAVVALVGGASPVTHESLSVWVRATGYDLNSLDDDPLFSNVSAGDFHLKTQVTQGRYDETIGERVNDAVTSPLIDAGDPSAGYDMETLDNGGRVNIGRYGNTWQASRSLAGPRLHAITFQRGGVATGTQSLAWVAVNVTTSSTVDIEYSRDAGESWVVITNGVSASQESIDWDTTVASNTPAAKWRVSLTVDSNVYHQTDGLFSIRNSPLVLFINDDSLLEDVYTGGAGDATNYIASYERPFNSLAGALALYDLEPGDTLFIDSGTYAEGREVQLGRRDSGDPLSPVNIIGTTNTFTGSIVQRGSASTASRGLVVENARWLSLSNLNFQAAGTGISVTNSHDIMLSVRATGHNSNGVVIGRSTNITLRGSVIAGNAGRGVSVYQGGVLRIEHSVIWSNGNGAVFFSGNNPRITNSVLTAHGAGRYIYTGGSTNDAPVSDYNNLLIRDNAQAGLVKFIA